MTEPRKEERRTILVRTLILLIILASFLVYAILSQSGGPPSPGPSVVTDAGLLITVILCVFISFWVTFAGQEAKGWKKGAWLFVGLICGSVMFGFLSLLVFFAEAGLDGPYWSQAYPATFYDMSMAWHFLFAIAIILAVAAFLALILILDSLEAAEARAHLQEST